RQPADARRAAQGRATQLRRADRAWHGPAHDVPGAADEPESDDRWPQGHEPAGPRRVTMASHHPNIAPVASREVLEYHEERAADPTKRILGPGQDYHSVTEKISGIILTKHTGKGWLIGFGIAFLMFMLLQYALFVLVTVGVGIWGINIPVGWGFAIVN